MQALQAAKRLAQLTVCPSAVSSIVLRQLSAAQQLIDAAVILQIDNTCCSLERCHLTPHCTAEQALQDQCSQDSGKLQVTRAQNIFHIAQPAHAQSTQHFSENHVRWHSSHAGVGQFMQPALQWHAYGALSAAGSRGSCGSLSRLIGRANARGLHSPSGHPQASPTTPGPAKSPEPTYPHNGETTGTPAGSRNSRITAARGGGGSGTVKSDKNMVQGAGWTRREVLNAPNLISLARLASGPVIAHWIVAGELRIALAVLVVSGSFLVSDVSGFFVISSPCA